MGGRVGRVAGRQLPAAIALDDDGDVLVSGYSLSILASMSAAANRGLQPLILSSLTMPAYWLLISAGAYRALFQLFSKPFHWEKTDHGLSRLWAEKRATALHDMSHQNSKDRHARVTLR